MSGPILLRSALIGVFVAIVCNLAGVNVWLMLLLAVLASAIIALVGVE